MLFQQLPQIFDLLQLPTLGTNLVRLFLQRIQLLLQGPRRLHHLRPGLRQPGVEGIGVFGEFLSQFIVVLLSLMFLQQLRLPFLDDLLQISPGLLQRVHRKPSVRVRPNVIRLDLLVQRLQLLEILFRRRQRRLKLRVGLA